MIAQIAGYLLILAVISLFKFRPQFERVITFLLTFSFFAVFVILWHGYIQGIYGTFSMLWDSSPAGDVRIEILSSVQNYQILLPFFAVTTIALFNNLFFRYEIHKKNYTSLLFFDLFCIIMLISGNHFIQLIAAVFIIDILSQILIKNPVIGRRYALFNLATDMVLFGLLAILNTGLDDLSLEHVWRFYQNQTGADYITILLMASLLIKFGFCFYEFYMADLKNMKFHKLILLPYFFSPAAALILFVKLYPLLFETNFFLNVFNVLLVLVLLYGLIGTMLKQNLKEKTIFMNMLLFAVMVKILEITHFNWNSHFSWLFVLSFVLNLVIYYLHYYTERNFTKNYTAKIIRSSSKIAKAIVLLWFVVLGAYWVQMAALLYPLHLNWLITFILILSFTAACMFHRALRHALPETEIEIDSLPFMILICMLIFSGYVFCLERQYWLFALGGCIISGLYLLWNPFERFCVNYNHLSVNAKENYINLRQAFIEVWAKIPNSTIRKDVLTWSLSKVVDGVITLFRKINRGGIMRYIVLIALGAAIFVLCFKRDIGL